MPKALVSAVSAAAAFAALCLGAAGCDATTAQRPKDVATSPTPAAPMDLPLTTTSDAARAHFLAGLHAFDMGDLTLANRGFRRAVKADPQFAVAHAYVAGSAASTEERASSLAQARARAAGASPAEQLIVENSQHSFDNDVEAQLANTATLIQRYPESARAWLLHAGVLENLHRAPEARDALDRALRIAPQLPAAHLRAGNNYLTSTPKDFDRATRHFEAAVRLVPNESAPYDFLGDAHRARNRLEDARRAYTMSAERAPDQGTPLQQRGHVNAFLGDYAAARADYEKAVELENARGGNLGPFLAIYRAWVNVYEGRPEAAVAEMREQLAHIDASNVEGKVDIKAWVLTLIARFATHSGDYRAAEAAMDELAEITGAQAAAIGNADFRRAQETNVLFLRGMLAARRGDQKGAQAFARQLAAAVAPDANPRKLERMHQILGMAAFYQRNHAGAEAELAQADPSDVSVRYHRALAQMEIGQVDQARRTFSELAVYNFNDPGYVLVRRDVLSRIGG